MTDPIDAHELEDFGATAAPATQRQIELARSREAITMSPDVAQSLLAAVAVPARKGMGKLLGKPAPMTVVLDPSRATLDKLKSGEAMLTRTKDGRRWLAQARDARTGNIVENIGIRPVAQAGKGAKTVKVAAGGATIAWQAMAMATQQHFLVEISGKLSGLETGVADLLSRERASTAADLETTRQELQLFEEHLANGESFDANDRQNLQRWHKEAMTAFGQAATSVKASLAKRDSDPTEVLTELAQADAAVAVAARCAATFLRLDYPSEQKRETEFWHYSEQTQTALDALQRLSEETLGRVKDELRRWDEFEDGRPRRIHQRVWNETGGRMGLRIGPPKPTFMSVKTISEDRLAWLHQHAQIGTPDRLDSAPALVVDGGRAWLLPADR